MNTNFKKIIILSSVIILFGIIVFTIIPNRNKMNLEIKPEQLTEVSTTTEQKISESNDFYDIDIKYPIEVRDIKRYMDKYVKSNLESIKVEWNLDGDLYKNELKLRKDFPDRPIAKYEYNVSYEKFESKKMNTISYIIKSYTFTGGAHGNTSLQTFTFDKNGLITIDVLLNLNKDNDKNITLMLSDKLKKTLGDQYNEEILKEGLGLSGNNIGFLYQTNLMKFVILDEGIKFIFDQYQIAPYAAGNPEVLLSWEELRNYLIK